MGTQMPVYYVMLFGKLDRQSLVAFVATRGKSGLHRAGCWITSSQRELKDSATEMDRRWPDFPAQARMEPRCKRPRGTLVTSFLVNPIWSKT